MSKPKHETSPTELSASDLSQVQGGLSIYIPPGSTQPFRPNIPWPLQLPRPLLVERLRGLLDRTKVKQDLGR